MSSAHFSFHLPPIPPSHFRLVSTLFSPHFHFNSTFFLHYFSHQLPSRFLSRYNFARVQTRRKLFRRSLSRKRTKKANKVQQTANHATSTPYKRNQTKTRATYRSTPNKNSKQTNKKRCNALHEKTNKLLTKSAGSDRIKRSGGQICIYQQR